MADVNPLKEDGSPKSPEEIAVETAALGNLPPAPGSKTPPELLLKSLQEERQKRQELEDRIALLENPLASPDGLSDEGRALQKQIKDQDAKIDSLTSDLAKKDILIAHPVLKEKWEEFETFRSDPENKGMNLRTAAKAFLVEKGLLDAPRKGLEKQTGGPRIPTSTKMSPEEITKLRTTNYREYEKKLMAGEFD